MRLSTKRKSILFVSVALICLATILAFTLSMYKSMEVDKATADHPLEVALSGTIYLSAVLGMLWIVALLLAASYYTFLTRAKSRSGMVIASGLLLTSISAVVFCWLVVIGIWAEVKPASRFVEFFTDEFQMINFLPAVFCFSVVYLIAWRIFTPLVRKWIGKKRRQLDTHEKKQGYRKYLQIQSAIFMVVILCLLPLSLNVLQNTETLWGIPEPTQTWYISAGVHSISGILAGIELVVGIRLLSDRTRGKVPVGALLLGSSFVSLFILGFCYLLIAGFAFDWGFGNYHVYTGSMLFVILHRIISAALLMITLLLCRKEKRYPII